MQPYFFPYLGYFQLMQAVDQWAVFDAVQFIDKGWINRNRILHPDPAKDWLYLTLPLAHRSRFDKICDLHICTSIDWRSQIFGRLSAYPKKAPYYRQALELVEQCLSNKETHLASFLTQTLRITAEYLGIQTNIVEQSELKLDYGTIEHPGQWALKISEYLGASEYVNPISGRSLFKTEEFAEANNKLSFLNPVLEVYDQHRKTFTPGLSIIDVLMFNSLDKVKGALNHYELVPA